MTSPRVLAIAAAALALAVTAGARAEDAKAPPPPGGSIFPKAGAPDPKPFTLQDRAFDAARRGDVAMFQLCLDKGVDPKAKDELGRSALAMAVRDGRNLEIVELLFARGVAVDDPDAVGRSPLHEAAGNADPPIVSWLLAHGAKVERKDMQGRTPLHSAVMAGSQEVVLLLLAAAADPNARDNFQDTPLIQACAKGLNEISRVLVEKGADPSLKDQEGRTAAERADDTAPYCRSLPAAKTSS
jgi:ankyrin repeat protein